MSDENLIYLHGFTEKEQQRLRDQARFAEYSVYKNINFSDCQKVIEIGCGVGAQTDILLRRYPDLSITGIDLNTDQLKSAKSFLESTPHLKDRYELMQMSAEQLAFKANSYDGAFLCWILEHVPNPAKVLSEVRRVLKPSGVIYCTEVLNSSFFLEPYSPHTWNYWKRYNDFQYDRAGDPFVGAKLGNLLQGIGFQNVETEVITWHFDNRAPEKRKMAIEFWSDLLLSASASLLEANYVTQKEIDQCRMELANVAGDPNAVFFYSFIQAKAVR